MNNVPFTLTPEEMRLIRAYRNLCDESLSFLVEVAEECTSAPSLKRHVKPSLRLVVNKVRDLAHG